MCLLKELYGSGVEKLRIKKHEFTTPSNKKLEIATLASNYHIEVTPSDAGMHDRCLTYTSCTLSVHIKYNYLKQYLKMLC